MAAATIGCSSSSNGDDEVSSAIAFTVTGPPEIIATGPAGGPFPGGERIFSVYNDGIRPLRFGTSSVLGWMDFFPEQGVVQPGENQRITVSIDQDNAALLSPGSFRGEIMVRDGQNPEGVPARTFQLLVQDTTGGGGLVISPEEGFEPMGPVGGALLPDAMVYTLENTTDADFEYSVTASEPWLLLTGASMGTLTSGSTATVQVTVDTLITDGFAAGAHPATLNFVNATTGEGSLELPVNLTLMDGGGSGRVTAGLSALYEFEEGGGNSVVDVSNLNANLEIETPSAVSWGPGILQVDSAAVITTPPTNLASQLMASDEVSIEAWITPSNITQDGPARIVTLADPFSGESYFMLGQGRWGEQADDVFTVRLSTTQHDSEPALTTPAGTVDTVLTHVVFTRTSNGAAKLYVDGNLSQSMTMPGTFDNWTSNYILTIANEDDGSRPWLGSLHLVALYDRALTSSEVDQNFQSGTGDFQTGHLTVTPGSDFLVTAPIDSDLTVHEKVYTLQNTGTMPISWSASSTAGGWISATRGGS